METLSRINRPFRIVIRKRAPDIVLPAMPIRILYFGSELDYSHEVKDGEHFFRISAPEETTPGWDFNSVWDAFKLRDSFEGLKNPEDAWNFLNVIGPFRFKRTRSAQSNVLTWHELKGWQHILSSLRRRETSEGFPMLGMRGRGFKEIFHRLDFVAQCRDFSEQIWTVSDETFEWLKGFPQGLSIRRDMYLSREETMDVFSSPGARVQGSCEWHRAQLVLARRRAERAHGNLEGKQRLIAEVTPATVLDAILATVFVDKLQGLDLQVCALKECNETFERPTDSRKKYCTNYHAHLASLRRKRAEAKQKRNRTGRIRGKEKA